MTRELRHDGAGTHLKVTEQGCCCRGEAVQDAAGREEGTRFLLEAIDRALSR